MFQVRFEASLFCRQLINSRLFLWVIKLLEMQFPVAVFRIFEYLLLCLWIFIITLFDWIKKYFEISFQRGNIYIPLKSKKQIIFIGMKKNIEKYHKNWYWQYHVLDNFCNTIINFFNIKEKCFWSLFTYLIHVYVSIWPSSFWSRLKPLNGKQQSLCYIVFSLQLPNFFFKYKKRELFNILPLKLKV